MNVKSRWKKSFAMLIAIIMVAAMLPANIAYAASANTLTAKYMAEGSLLLKWSAEEDGRWYNVCKAEKVNGKAGTFKVVNSNYFDDNEPPVPYETSVLAPGKTYYYKVKILDENKKLIKETNTVKYTVKLDKPKVKIHTDIASGKPVLKWGSLKNATKYQVYRATKKNGTYSRVLTTTKLTYTNTAATAGQTYYYKVKAIAQNNTAANSDFSAVVSAKAGKADKNLATAVKNTSRKKVTTLTDTMSVVSKAGLKHLAYFDGGWELCMAGKVNINDVYDFSKIKKAGAVVKADEAVRGDPFFIEMEVYPQKNGVKYPAFRVKTYGMNIHKVKKNSTQKTCINDIKATVNKYYPSSKWNVTVEKFSASSKKFSSEIKDVADTYNYWLDDSGYGKYKSNKYVLKIKKKSDSKVQSWTFVTAVPTL